VELPVAVRWTVACSENNCLRYWHGSTFLWGWWWCYSFCHCYGLTLCWALWQFCCCLTELKHNGYWLYLLHRWDWYRSLPLVTCLSKLTVSQVDPSVRCSVGVGMCMHIYVCVGGGHMHPCTYYVYAWTASSAHFITFLSLSQRVHKLWSCKILVFSNPYRWQRTVILSAQKQNVGMRFINLSSC
jgi:hypothetical protein